MLWAPLCGTLHWANHKLQAAAAIQTWLAEHDLLDLPPQHKLLQQQQQQLMSVQQQQSQQQHVSAQQEEQQQLLEQQQQPKVPVSFEDMPWREKVIAIEAIKQRELAALHEGLRAQEAEARAAELQERRRRQREVGPEAAGEGDSSSSTQRRRWWLLW